MDAPATLPAIPFHDVVDGGTLALLARERARVDALTANARRSFGAASLVAADWMSRRWLARNATPYRAELLAVAAVLRRPGAVALNVSYEWGCTTGSTDDAGGGTVMLRTVDWPHAGLAAGLVVARRGGAAGDFLDVTWPGCVGVFTALAPGRFALAINQAPMTPPGRSVAGGWLAMRRRLRVSRALPPAHLARLACEAAPDFAAALDMLARTPVALPVIFALAGTAAGEAAVVERREDAARVTVRAGVACVNDWQAAEWPRRPRGHDNGPRRAMLEAALAAGPGDGFDWLAAPVLNAMTRLAVVARPRSGALAVLGLERGRAATRVFRRP